MGVTKCTINNAEAVGPRYKTEAEVQNKLRAEHLGYYEERPSGMFLRLQKGGDKSWSSYGAWPKCMHHQCGGGRCQGHPNSSVKKVVDKERQLHLKMAFSFEHDKVTR